MSFLQPLFLAGLALAALPIIIHLINQRRYQTIRWGAMMFLLAANRMSRGFARVRQWLILLLRTAAVACLAFVVARPLAGGWLSLASAGRADATIVILDRSPSMQQQDSSAGQTKLEAGRRQLVEALQQLPSSRWALIESASNKPREFESVEALERAFADLQIILSPDEGEALAQFQQEAFELVQEIGFQLALVKRLLQGKEIEDIRVFERLPDQVGLRAPGAAARNC